MSDLFCVRCGAPAVVIVDGKALCSACAAASVRSEDVTDDKDEDFEIKVLFLNDRTASL